jgi:hypothetical protein
MGDKRMTTWKVSCDGHGTVMVMADTEDEAGVKAAEKWQVPWPKVAAYLTVTACGSALIAKCPRCRREYVSDGARRTYCPACESQRRVHTADFVRRNGLNRRKKPGEA